MRKQIITVVVLLVISCTKPQPYKNYFTIEDFPYKKALKGVSSYLDNLNGAAHIKIIPEYNLLIATEMKGDYLGKVFTLDSLKFIKSFIKNGNDASEQLSVVSLQYDKERRLLYAGDVYKHQLFFYALDSLNNSTSSSKPINTIDFSGIQIFNAFAIDSNKFINQLFNNHTGSFGLYNSNGELLDTISSYPPHSKDYQPNELFSVFKNGINISDDKNSVIVSYHFTDYIDIYDTKGNLQQRIQGPDIIEPRFIPRKIGGGMAMIPHKNSHRTYVSNAHMKHKILALYSGGVVQNTDYHANRLFQFDDELQPQILYQLEQPIFTFDIDWDTGTLYGLTHQGADNLVKYQIQIDDDI